MDEIDLNAILVDALECRASDIILGGDEPPRYRLAGQLLPRGDVPLEAHALNQMFFRMLTPGQIERLEMERQVDLSLDSATLATHRFRLNIFYRHSGLAAVIRPISRVLPTPQSLNLPMTLLKQLDQSTGLILVTGRTGHGKSTICASLIEHLNNTRPCHIVTLEDPIEFVFDAKIATISQREIREHATSFQAALKSILRQSPDVIFVGEMRDVETISATLSVAETGHLVLGNLHTSSAIQTIHRVVDAFNPDERSLIQVQLANALKSVICQVLVPRADGSGLVAAREILINNVGIANVIRRGELHQLVQMMSTAGDVTTMERSLAELYVQGQITIESARSYSPDPEMLKMQIDSLRERQRVSS